MKKFIPQISRKQILWACGGIFCLILIGAISLMEGLFRAGLYDQQMAKRWSSKKNVAQISCFFAAEEVSDKGYFTTIGHTVDKALKEANIVPENENSRLWIDAISRSGKVTLSNGSKSVELEAVGVQGEFFQFHPLRLLEGAFFGPDSMMQDGVVIDEDAAWQLFGSNDVAGMQVMIGQVPHYITGVVQRETGRLAEAAGLDKSLCYLNLENLEQYGKVTGGYCYEMVLPNPVEGFALSTLSKAVGTEGRELEILENTGRYELLPLIKVIGRFGVRSMSKKSFAYPYWENVARGYEDIFALTLLLKAMLSILPCVLAVVTIIRLWKRKNWTLKQGYHKLADRLYDYRAKRHTKKKSAAQAAEWRKK